MCIRDSFASFQRFNDFVACKNSEFDTERRSTFYSDLSEYFTGIGKDGRYGKKHSDREDGGEYWRKTLQPTVSDENGNETFHYFQDTRTDGSGRVMWRDIDRK